MSTEFENQMPQNNCWFQRGQVVGGQWSHGQNVKNTTPSHVICHSTDKKNKSNNPASKMTGKQRKNILPDGELNPVRRGESAES